MLKITMEERDMFSFEQGDKGITLFTFKEGADIKYNKAAMLTFQSKKQAIQLKDTLINLIEEM